MAPTETPTPDEIVAAVTEADETVVPVVYVEPADDESGDAVELVRTGWVRLRSGTKTIRMRRPFLGELKSIRMLLEDVGDEIAERSEQAQLIAAEIMRDAAEIDSKPESETTADDLAANVSRRAAMSKRSKIAGRELIAFAEDQRIGWWRAVVKLVGVDGDLPSDDELPAWIVSPQLPAQVLDHWRSVPLGRG